MCPLYSAKHRYTDSKATIQTLKQHLIKCNNVSQSNKIYNRDVYRIWRSKKLEDVQDREMSQVLKGKLEYIKRQGKRRSFWARLGNSKT